MIDNEKSIIGCILINSNCLYGVYEHLREEMFTDATCRQIYRECLAMYDMGERVTVVELSRRIEKHEGTQFEIIGFLKECFGLVINSNDIKSHAKSVISEYKVKQVKEIIEKPTYMANEIENIISDLLVRLEELKTNQTVKSKSLAEVVEENKDNYFKEIETKKIYTGFKSIDECIGGLEGGEIFVIGARPGVGKSAFVTQIITNMAEKGLKVGYFNLEMSYKQVYERILARFSKLGLTRIKKAKHFLNDEKERFDKANEKMNMRNLIISSGSKKISDVKAESRHQEFDVIIIDYLQLIRPDRIFNNRASEVGEISKSLKGLAMELNIPVIALSQMNRENDETQEPNISDLRESGDIEQDASIIALMWNMNETDKGFKIGKNRQGELLKIAMNFDGNNMEFTEKGSVEETKPAPKKRNVSEGMPWD